jgi:hypothetical protein
MTRSGKERGYMRSSGWFLCVPRNAIAKVASALQHYHAFVCGRTSVAAPFYIITSLLPQTLGIFDSLRKSKYNKKLDYSSLLRQVPDFEIDLEGQFYIIVPAIFFSFNCEIVWISHRTGTVSPEQNLA